MLITSQGIMVLCCMVYRKSCQELRNLSDHEQVKGGKFCEVCCHVGLDIIAMDIICIPFIVLDW